jgi:hypothetical protein
LWVLIIAKLPRRFGFAIEHTDSATSLRYYEPDFVAVDQDGRHYVIETKGQENIDVATRTGPPLSGVRRDAPHRSGLIIPQGATGRVRETAADGPV